MKKNQLKQLLHKEIPITKALAIDVENLSVDQIIINAKFEENKNIHNTAFAGSIYTIATLAGWSLITNYLEECNLPGVVVLASADIKYKRPITGDINARCQLPKGNDIEDFKNRLLKKGRAKLKICVSVIEDDQIKAQFEGNFAVV